VIDPLLAPAPFEPRVRDLVIPPALKPQLRDKILPEAVIATQAALIR
jgi:hypothetical protein